MTEWKKHDGGPCPLQLGLLIEVSGVNPAGEFQRIGPFILEEHDAQNPSWEHHKFGQMVSFCGVIMQVGRIDYYRVLRPRALEDLRELVREQDAPDRVPVPG